MRKLLIVMSAVGLLLSACGSDDGAKKSSDDSKSTTTAKAASDASGGAALKPKLLTIEDLPAGFTKASEDVNDGDADPNKDDSPDDEFCKELASIAKQYKTDGEASIEFQTAADPAGAGFFNEQLMHFGSKSDAVKGFALFKKALTEQCKELTDAESGLTGTFSAMSFPKVADDTFAVALDATQDTGEAKISLQGQMVTIRKGNVIGLLFNFGFGSKTLSIKQVEALVRKAADKL